MIVFQVKYACYQHERVEKEISLLPSLLLSPMHACERKGEGEISSPILSISRDENHFRCVPPFFFSFSRNVNFLSHICYRVCLVFSSPSLPLFLSLSPLSNFISSLPLPPLVSLFLSLDLSPYPAIDLPLSLKSHPLLSSPFVCLVRHNFSPAVPFPLSSLFSLLPPPFFSLITAHSSHIVHRGELFVLSILCNQER